MFELFSLCRGFVWSISHTVCAFDHSINRTITGRYDDKAFFSLILLT